MSKDKIRSIIASHLKGEITSIDEAAEQIAVCPHAQSMNTTLLLLEIANAPVCEAAGE